MDAEQFDRVVKSVGQGTGRRHLLAGLLGSALAGSLGVTTGSARHKHHHRKHKSGHGTTFTGTCQQTTVGCACWDGSSNPPCKPGACAFDPSVGLCPIGRRCSC